MEQQLPVAVVCRVLGAPRSTVSARRQQTVSARSGPATAIGDQDLVQLIRLVLRASPFAGEGYRKVRARLRRQHGVHVSGKRVLGLLRREGCWHPSGSAGAANRGRMTARSSLMGRTCVGHRRDHGLDQD
jgi:HTH-like domain